MPACHVVPAAVAGSGLMSACYHFGAIRAMTLWASQSLSEAALAWSPQSAADVVVS